MLTFGVETVLFLPLFGAFIADSYLGRYRTILISSLVYIRGLGLLTLSAMLPSSISYECPSIYSVPSCSLNLIQVILFFLALYMVALAQGGHRPCVEAFGADQFDGQDPEKFEARGSFFNWWYLGICGGSLMATLVSKTTSVGILDLESHVV